METGGVAVGRSEIATSSLEWLSISLLEWYRIYLLDIRTKQLTDLADVVWCHYSIVRISYKSLLTTHRPLHCIHILNQTSSLSSHSFDYRHRGSIRLLHFGNYIVLGETSCDIGSACWYREGAGHAVAEVTIVASA